MENKSSKVTAITKFWTNSFPRKWSILYSWCSSNSSPSWALNSSEESKSFPKGFSTMTLVHPGWEAARTTLMWSPNSDRCCSANVQFSTVVCCSIFRIYILLLREPILDLFDKQHGCLCIPSNKLIFDRLFSFPKFQWKHYTKKEMNCR